MTTQRALKKKARALAAAQNIPYSQALASLRPGADAVRYVLHPTAAEAAAGITAEELGVRALPADATPEQRAHAEAVWRAAEADQPCRCSGQCHHGTACEEEFEEYEDPEAGQSAGAVQCGGRLVHADRFPGGLFSLTIWHDVYVCTECETNSLGEVTLPEVPYGEQAEGSSAIVFYDGTRHPMLGVIDDGPNDVDDYFDDDPDHERYDECEECGAVGDLDAPEHAYHCPC